MPKLLLHSNYMERGFAHPLVYGFAYGFTCQIYMHTLYFTWVSFACSQVLFVYLFDDLPIRNFILFKFHEPKVLEFQPS